MRYIIFILISQFAICGLKAQTLTQPGLRDYQISGGALYDSILYIMGTDTVGTKRGLGKWYRGDSLVNGLGDHDFYGLNTGRSPFAGEDSIETALDTMYVLFKGLHGGLATKIEMMKEGYINFDSDTATNNGSYAFKVQPMQTTHDNPSFNLSRVSNFFPGDPVADDGFSLGLNCGPLGREDATKKAMYWAFESHFTIGANTVSEMHFIKGDTLGNDFRVETWKLDDGDPDLFTVSTNVNQFNIRKATMNPLIDPVYIQFNRETDTQTNMRMFGASSDGDDGIQMIVNTDDDILTFAPYSSMPSTATFNTRSFDITDVNKFVAQATTAGSYHYGMIKNGASNVTSNTARLALAPHDGYTISVAPYIEGYNDSNDGGIRFGTYNGGLAETFRIAPNGALRASQYDGSPITGTPFHLLGHETDGDFISATWSQVADSLAANGGGADADWYESGATAPNNIADEMYHTGEVHIGDAAMAGTGQFNILDATGTSRFYFDGDGSGFPRISIGGSSGSVAGIFNRITSGASIYFGEDADAGGTFFRGTGGLTASSTVTSGHSWAMIKNEATNGTSNKARLSLGPHSGYDNTVAPYIEGYNVSNDAGLRFGTYDGGLIESMKLGVDGELTLSQYVTANFNGGVAADSVLVITSSGVVKKRDAADVAGAGGTTDLTIGGAGPTYTIESSTGTDVTVANLYGLTLTESPANTLNFEVDSSKLATQYDITQIPISSLKAAAASNTINNANYPQEWQWNTLAGITGLKLSSTSTAAASNLQKILEISTTGVNGTASQSTYAAYLSNTHSGATSTNYGLYSVATGAATANYGLYGTSNSTGATGNVGAGVSGRNSNGGIAVEGITTAGGTGVYAESPDGVGLKAYTTNGTAGLMQNHWSTTNDYGSILDLYRSSSGGAGAAGIGGGIAFYTETSTSANQISNQLKSIWTTATNASRVSDFIITGLNAATEADLLTIKGSGQMQFNKYTAGAFTSGTPIADLFVDASGFVIAGSMNGQSWTMDADDATTPILVSNQTVNVKGNAGIVTDIVNATVDSLYIAIDGDEFTTVTTPEATDYMLVHDENGASADVLEKILWSDLASLVASDGNGLWTASNDNTNIANSTFEVGVPGYLDFRDGSEHDLYIDAANDRIGMGTNGPSYGLHVLNDAGVSLEPSSSAIQQIVKIEGTADGGGANTATANLKFSYTDADYAGGVEQTALDLTIHKESDTGNQWTTAKLTLVENTDADAIVMEKNVDFTNTTESHIAFNGGISYTQNYDLSTSGDLNLDRSYYTVNITGGVIGDTIKLPEVAATTDNWTNTITSAQCQVGQEYVITNARSGTNLVIGAYNPAGTSDDLIGTRAAPGGSAGSAITVLPGKSVIIKCYQLAGGIGYWNYWLSN